MGADTILERSQVGGYLGGETSRAAKLLERLNFLSANRGAATGARIQFLGAATIPLSAAKWAATGAAKTS